MRHCIVGAGGVGGVIASVLARSGQPVTLIVRPEAINSYPPQIQLEGELLGNFTVPVAVAAMVDGTADVIWLTTKATQLTAALTVVPPQLLGNAVVIPLLNGIDHVAQLRTIYGHNRVAVGTIMVGAEKLAPGRFRQAGRFVSMQLAGPQAVSPRLRDVSLELDQAGVQCRVTGDEGAILWQKLFAVAPFALTSSASGLDLGGLRANPVWRQHLLDCSVELQAAAAKQGVHLEGDWLDRTAAIPDSHVSSMQLDVEAGRTPELDAIAGPILGGSDSGVSAPVTQFLTACIRERVDRTHSSSVSRQVD